MFFSPAPAGKERPRARRQDRHDHAAASPRGLEGKTILLVIVFRIEKSGAPRGAN
jgi:hypothetical protein